jgi:hypothetical protein
MKNPKYIIADCSGGIGKHIAFTAVISNIKAAYPDSKIIVVCAWPRTFINHPDCWRVYGNSECRFFYDDYIKDKDFLFFKSEPYHHTDYIKKERHLIDVWTEQCGVPLIHTTPKLYINPVEQLIFRSKYVTDNRPLLILQPNGGMNLPFVYSWVRDMPLDFVNKIVGILKPHFKILHIRMNNQHQYGDGVISVTTDDIRELFCVLNLPAKRLLIDSFGQHACAALGQRANVLWPIDNAKILGYETNTNIVGIVPSELQRPYAYIEEYRLEGVLSDYPYGDKEIFDAEKVAELLLQN